MPRPRDRTTRVSPRERSSWIFVWKESMLEWRGIGRAGGGRLGTVGGGGWSQTESGKKVGSGLRDRACDRIGTSGCASYAPWIRLTRGRSRLVKAHGKQRLVL